MTLILDSSGLLAAIDSAQQDHAAASEALEATRGSLVISPFVLAELDHMVSTRLGQGRELALIGEVIRGTYTLERFSEDDLEEAVGVTERYADFGLGLADASNVVLVNRHGTLNMAITYLTHQNVVQYGYGKSCKTAENAPRSGTVLLRPGRGNATRRGHPLA